VRRIFGLALVQRILSPARGDRTVHKFIRYSMVSGVAIVISQVVILVATDGFHASGILANTLGAVAATPASYELNRKWAWGKHGKSHLWREVAPFWGLTLIGYLGSTGTVQLADNFCHSHHVIGLERSLAIMAASLFAYGVVWVGKFLIIHHLMFGGHKPGAGPSAPPTVVGTSSVPGNGASHDPAPAAGPAVPTPVHASEGHGGGD